MAADVDLTFAQGRFVVHRRDDGQLHLLDLVLGQPLLGQPLPDQELVVRTERVHPDLLADQVARRADGAAVQHEVSRVLAGVGTVGTQHRRDRCPRGIELDDGSVECRAELDVAGGRRLDVLRAAGGVADPFELDLVVIAQVLGEFVESHVPGPPLVAQDRLPVLGGGSIRRAGAPRHSRGQREQCCGRREGAHGASPEPGVGHRHHFLLVGTWGGVHLAASACPSGPLSAGYVPLAYGLYSLV